MVAQPTASTNRPNASHPSPSYPLNSQPIAPPIQPLTSAGGGFQTKQEMVYRSLRERIMEGHLQPGQRLVIDEIANAYGVSPIPVREALHLLQAERLVEIKPHLGAAVAPISPSAINEIFVLMECLEMAALRLAVKNVTHEHTAMLQSLIVDMEESRGDFERWAERNFAFHNVICSIAEMPRVREMTVRVFTEWERMRKHLFRGVPTPDLDQAHKDHVTMVDALKKHDLERLERLTRVHNQSALKSYLRLSERKSV